MGKFKDWVIDEVQKEEELESIQEELAVMTVNDFCNLVDEHSLEIEVIDNIFWELRDKLYEERNKNEQR
jgi:hypothetical protein|tara:strand:- start:514 stop:720 length:207 start_codon:yes stop_codon:yes gene_type:complete